MMTPVTRGRTTTDVEREGPLDGPIRAHGIGDTFEAAPQVCPDDR